MAKPYVTLILPRADAHMIVSALKEYEKVKRSGGYPGDSTIANHLASTISDVLAESK